MEFICGSLAIASLKNAMQRANGSTPSGSTHLTLSWPALFAVAGFTFVLGVALTIAVAVAANVPGWGRQSPQPQSPPSEAVTDAPAPDNSITTLPVDPETTTNSSQQDVDKQP
jgi:hypothetical protein